MGKKKSGKKLKIRVVDIGVNTKNKVTLVNTHNGRTEASFTNGLDMMLFLSRNSHKYRLKVSDGVTEQLPDDDFDKWLEESSIGGGDD